MSGLVEFLASDASRSPRELLLLSLLDSLRAHLIKARFILTVGATKVSTTNAYLLAELELNPQCNVPELAKLLCLNKSSVSRGLKQLLAQGYLSLHKEGASRTRRKSYQLSAKAERFLAQDRKSDEGLVTILSRSLTSVGLEKLGMYLEQFAEGAQSPPLPVLPHALEGGRYKIFQSFRRLTRAHGVTSGNYLDSGFGVDVWVLLSEILYRGRKTTELARQMKMDGNVLSQLLRQYKKNAWLHIIPDDIDRRANQLKLTDHGREVLGSIEKCAINRFSQQLSKLSESELQEMVNLLRDYSGAAFPPRIHVLEGGNSYVRAFVTEAELVSARWLLVRQLAQDSHGSYALGPSLFSPANLCLGVYRGSELVAAAELLVESGSPVRMLNRCGDLGILGSDEFQGALRRFTPSLGE